MAAEDDTGPGLDPNEIADLGDAMTYLNQALASFGVNLSWAAAGTTADVTVHFAAATPEGGVADGVLGYTTPQNDVYFVTGWNYSTSTDPTQVGPDQFDFLTLAIHELGHTHRPRREPGSRLGHVRVPVPGTVRRTFTDSNLSLIDTDADRFMKAASGFGPARHRRPADDFVVNPAAPQGIGEVPTLLAPLDAAHRGRSLDASSAQSTLVAANPKSTSISGVRSTRPLFPKAVASKSRLRTEPTSRTASSPSVDRDRHPDSPASRRRSSTHLDPI